MLFVLVSVGETGLGKTAVIQYLAAQAGKQLFVQNMNQQSDSSDLLGGYQVYNSKQNNINEINNYKLSDKNSCNSGVIIIFLIIAIISIIIVSQVRSHF